MGKIKKFEQNFLPESLEGSNFYGYSRSFLTQGGYVVHRYNNTGTVLVNRYDEKQVVMYDYKNAIVTWCSSFPRVITLHDDDMLQIINLTEGWPSSKFQLHRDI